MEWGFKLQDISPKVSSERSLDLISESIALHSVLGTKDFAFTLSVTFFGTNVRAYGFRKLLIQKYCI